jgi:hypothetical protein
MGQDNSKGMPLTDPFSYGTGYQRRCIERWQGAGWAFLHWTEVPGIMAILGNAVGDIIFIDENGWAWKGPIFSRARPVPLEKYPVLKSNESI